MTEARGTEVQGAGSEIAENLRESGQALLVALIDRLARMAREQIEELSTKLEEFRQDGGAGVGALLAGAQAALAGRNPVLAAIKGGFAALTTPMKVVAVLALVLAALLAPVLAVVVLLVLIVLGVVAAIGSGSS